MLAFFSRTAAPAAALAAWAALVAAPVQAQQAPAPEPAPAAPTAAPAPAGMDFPADAQPLSASELDARLRGRVYSTTLPNGAGWRADYKTSGYVFVNTTSGGSDTGQWRIEEGKVCVEYRGRFRSGCTEMRASPDGLYAKSHATGEVFKLTPRD